MCFGQGVTNTAQGAGTQSGSAYPTVQYTAANAPPDPSTVPTPRLPDTANVTVDEAQRKSPDQKTTVADSTSDTAPVNATNVDVQYDKDGLPIRRKKGN